MFTADHPPFSLAEFAHLLAQARARDPVALTALYRHALPPIYRYVHLRIQRADVVEDVVGEIMLELVEALPTLRATHEAGFFAWLFQIARSKIMTALRQQVREATHTIRLPAAEVDTMLDALPAPEHIDPATWYEQREVLRELGSALEELTTEQQFVIVGRFLAGQSIAALAHALQKQPGAIRALQFRALTALAARLGYQRQTGGHHEES